ncbi:hypothetical protein DPMN_097167 [Dreissena polymorpha]|uniref:Uncharacterized protein n=1 Tax=Dreissena polymorpha TaxID=45954 RepID=A0A9D4LCG3_DREPO|nr:hypothetical protein DPMN_097167 [Dreissena polymorpha]
MALLKINFATIEEFRLLPGIGAKRATLLLQLRDKYGQLDEELFSIVNGGPVPRNVMDMVDFTPNIQNVEVPFQTEEGEELSSYDNAPDFRNVLSAPTSEKQSRAVSNPDQLAELFSQVEHSYSAIGDITRRLNSLPEVPSSHMERSSPQYIKSAKRLSFGYPTTEAPNLDTDKYANRMHTANAPQVRPKHEVKSVQKEYSGRDVLSSRHQKRCRKSLSGSRSRDPSESGSYEGQQSSKSKVEIVGHGQRHRDRKGSPTHDFSLARSSYTRHQMRTKRNDSCSSSSSYDRSRDRSRKDNKYRSHRR